jgi:radical SAM superfamily enzyme YgiQ (UPF0313 family)
MLPEPLGLESIAASLGPGHEAAILDMRLEPGLGDKLAAFRPDAVGVSSCFTSDVHSALRVLEIVEEHDPGILTFAGGQHATMAHVDFAGRADAVVLGEGELTVPQLLDCWERGWGIDDVGGLAFRRNDSWVTTAARRPAEDLDKIPSPARQTVSKYLPHYFFTWRRPVALVETSRGCPYRCKFCAVWRFFQHSFRTRSPQKVVEELSQIESEDILFADDSALADPGHSERIADEIKRAGLRKRYIMQVRADSVINCRDVLAKWRSVGLDSVFVGFESIAQRELDYYGKRLAVSRFEEIIGTLRALDINVTGSFIVRPDFEAQDFAALRRFVKGMKLSMPVFSILTPLPGTVLYEERKHEIVSQNYELYDLLHPILPTSLGLREFYGQFVGLYAASYYKYLTPGGIVRPLAGGHLRSLIGYILRGLIMLKNNHPRALV